MDNIKHALVKNSITNRSSIYIEIILKKLIDFIDFFHLGFNYYIDVPCHSRYSIKISSKRTC